MRQSLWLICPIIFIQLAFGSLDYEILWNVKSDLGFSGPNVIRDTRTGRTIGIVACEVGKGIAYFNIQGERLWDYPLSVQVTAYPAVADVDGDGNEDIVACGGSGEVVVLTNNGNLIWSAQTPAAVIAESCPAIADLDDDDEPEILVGDTGGTLSCFNNKGNLIWQFRGDGSQMGPVLVADIYQLAGKEIIITSHDNHIYALSAKGEWLWDIYQVDDLFPNSTPLLADVDGDHQPELYIGGGLHHFYRIDLQKAEIEMKENTLLHVNSAIAASDIDNDGKDEIIFGNKGGVARCYDETGFIWKQEFQNGNMSLSPILVNLDEDKDLEILFLFGIIHALDTDGKILLDKKLPGAINSPPLAGDFNDDGKLETIAAGYSLHGRHQIACFQWNVPYQKTDNDWTVFTGSRSHAGFNYLNESFLKYDLAAKTKAASSENFTSTESLQILSGNNIWGFDIINPKQKRLILSTQILYPDGSVKHFANHVHAAKERISVPFLIKDPGNYELSQQLIDADARILFATHRQTIVYEGLVGDKKYLTSLFLEIENVLHSWEKINPKITNGIRHQLVLLRGALSVLEKEKNNQIAQNLSQILESTRRLLSLTKAGQSLAPSRSFIAWEYCPWAYFDSKETLPTEKDKLKPLNVKLCRGEYESMALNVTNLSLNNQEVRVIPPEIDNEQEFSLNEHLQFRRAVKVPTISSEQIFDALPQLDEAQTISIAPLETQQLWITISTKDLSAGDYKTEIKLKNLDPVATEVIIPILIKIYDLALPRPRPLRFCVWAYAADWQDYELNDLIDHGVTIHFGISPDATCNADGVIEGNLEFTQHDASVKRLAQHGFLLFITPQNKLKGQPFLSEPWKTAFVQYLREWVVHMKKLGIDYNDWALYPYDEPSTPHAHATVNLVEVAKLVREADPNILIYTDPTSGANEKTLEMFKGLIDIWCPSSELLERFGDKIIPFAKEHGKEVWFYDAAGKAKTLSPLGIYRWRFWYAWNLGLTGAGWWTYSYGENYWDGPNEIGDYWATIYKSPGEIVTSKRWEVSREGVEDYEILFLLRESIQQARELGFEGQELLDAEKVLQELPKSIEQTLLGAGRRIPLNTDGVPHYSQVTEEVQKAREQIIETCIRLNKAME